MSWWCLLLLQGLLHPTHPINVTYGGYTANLVITLNLPVLQSVGFSANTVSLKVGNQLPSLLGLFTQDIQSAIDLNLPPSNLTYSLQLADGLLTDLAGVPVLGPLLIGPLTAQLNQLLDGLQVVDGVLTLAPGLTGLLSSILDNQLLQALGLNILPIDLRATVNGVTSAPLRIELGR